MIDTLRLAERIERELHASPELARAAAHIARDVAEEATRGLATKQDVRAIKSELALLKAELELAIARQTVRIGVMLGAAVAILAGIAVIPPLMQWILRA
jgi:hypothetical protein